MSGLFKIKESKYNLRRENAIGIGGIHTSTYGLNSISYLGPKIWDLVPNDIKHCAWLQRKNQKLETNKLSLRSM